MLIGGRLSMCVLAGGREESATGGSRSAGEVSDGAEIRRCRPERFEGGAVHRGG